MHYSKEFVVVVTFLAFTLATPSPARLVPRSCSTVSPSYLQEISEANPYTVGSNDLTTFWLQQEYVAGSGMTNQIYEVAQFDLPSAALAVGAEPLLVYCFPENYDHIFYTIGLSKPPIIQAYPLAAIGDTITPYYQWSWDNIIANDLYTGPVSSTFSLNPGECGQIAAVDVRDLDVVPVDGVIGYMFEIVWPTAETALNLATFGSGAGIFVIYNCFPPF